MWILKHSPVSAILQSFLGPKICLEQCLTDAVIKIQDVEFQVHKIILCNHSPYFRVLFTSWSKPDQRVFEIPGLSPDMMQLIIEFAYTGTVSITEDNVQDLLLAADQLLATDVIHACWNFLEERLCPENCIGIWSFADICLCPEMQSKAYKYIIDNFGEVAFTDEFLHLPVEELRDILGRDDLIVRQEADVLTAAYQWITYAPEERKKYFVELFSKVRLALTSAEFINMTIQTNELVKSSAECLKMVNDAMFLRDLMRDYDPPVYAARNTVARPRLPSAVLLAIGGWSIENATNCIEAYDFRTDIWINVENDMEARAHHGTVVYDGCVYCLGGFDRVKYLNSVCKFDPSTRTWCGVAPMNFRRSYVSVALLNGYIYAMGGYDGHNHLNSAERYSPETNQWTVTAPMTERRSNAGSTTLHNKIYICGGLNVRECLRTCESYQPEANQWTEITPMSTVRCGFGLITYAGQIFAVGGFDGCYHLCSAEAYNPRRNTWSAVAPMLTPRSNFGSVVIEDRLFVVGGYCGESSTRNVEYYEAETRAWFEACGMRISRSALSCCTVTKIPNMAEYTVPRDTLPHF